MQNFSERVKQILIQVFGLEGGKRVEEGRKRKGGESKRIKKGEKRFKKVLTKEEGV